MKNTYTSKDILQMAIQAKTRGIELYRALAKNSENYHVGQLFKEFAKDEERHKLELEKWFDYMDGAQIEEAYPGEKALYLKALVDANSFNCDKTCHAALETTISEEEALRAGINFEKDFMLFLHDLKSNVTKETGSTIDSLLDDEIRHLREMFLLKDKIAGE